MLELGAHAIILVSNQLDLVFKSPQSVTYEIGTKAEKNILRFRQPDPTYRNWPTLDFFLRKRHFLGGLYN